MKIIEYKEKYLEDIKDLLVELEEYIVSIDKDNLDNLHPDLREKLPILNIERIKNNNGKCYIAVENDKAVAVIMGIVRQYDKYDYLDYKCPKEGVITELIVTKRLRSSGLGKQLIQKMEDYFRSIKCEYAIIEVFAYNVPAINFYNKQGYHTRCLTDIKKL